MRLPPRNSKGRFRKRHHAQRNPIKRRVHKRPHHHHKTSRRRNARGQFV